MRTEPWGTPSPHQPRRSAWQVAGIVLVAILALLGLLFVAMVVFFWVGMSTYGSNK
jgi:hypothetical protein